MGDDPIADGSFVQPVAAGLASAAQSVATGDGVVCIHGCRCIELMAGFG